MSLTLPIQVGKQYVRRDGAVVKIACIVGNLFYVAVKTNQFGDGYVDTGRAYSDSNETHHSDLIADHIPATGHPHAVLMAQYAADAAETVEPWLRWQCQNPALGTPTRWSPLGDHPEWNAFLHYRRKPKTIRIGEHDVPEPLRRPIEQGTDYWLVDLVNGRLGATECTNFTPSTASAHMALGLVHLTREAAEQHARALLAFTQVQA